MKISKILFNRVTVFGVLLLIQLIWLFALLFKLVNYSTEIDLFFKFLSALVVLWIINKADNPAYKLAWIIPILIFPLFGGFLYLAFGNKQPAKKLRLKLEKVYEGTNKYYQQDEEVLKELENENNIYGQVSYLSKFAGYPVYKNTITKYYTLGEENFKILLEELKNAKKYIFMEYFIVEEGKMWDSILQILEEKAKEGLDVRVMYDDMGSLSVLPYKYYEQLEEKGIKSIAFNPFTPFLSLVMNNRDHRKITVIDGHTAFTGGINLADEYINEKVRFGHWKDTGVMIKGEAAWSFAVMFLQMWNANRPTDDNYLKFKPDIEFIKEIEDDGYVLPYGDTPLDKEILGENVYLNILNQAKKYVYIFTPYLIIDNEMITALTLAAKRGVDVRLVTPGIPDKKAVFKVTQSYYPQLLNSGVRIYEYTPGFLHAKSYVCDDEIATVGTINMDYRSLYLHFECGVYLYKTNTIKDIKKDALDTISKSKEIIIEDCIKLGALSRLNRAILRVFAPLM